MESKNQKVEEVKAQVLSGVENFKQEITTAVPVSFNFTLSKTVRIVSLVVALYLTYRVVPHWFSVLSSGDFDFIGIFSPFNGALSAIKARMVELLLFKTALTAALYCVAFPRHTIFKLQEKFAAKPAAE
jgi:hypothetical protein